MFTKELIIDARGHLLGRLASIIVKEIQNGQKVTVVRCEEIVMSGSLYRHKLKWATFKCKRMNSNPRRGHVHQRAPAKMFQRVMRGMMKHKTPRCQAAMGRLKTFEGIPHPYDKKKRMVIPQALRILRVKPNRKSCMLGDLCQEVGWKHQDLVSRLEEKRKTRSSAFFAKKKALGVLKAKATASTSKSVAAETAVLAPLGM